MALNINKLLLKKGWTGAEVGKLLMASLINDLKHHGEPDHKPLFTQAQFDRMASKLPTERDYLVLNMYITLYDSVSTVFNKSQALMQQAWHGYYRYIMHVSFSMNAEQEQAQMLATKTEWNPILADYTLEKLCGDDDYHQFIRGELLGCINLMATAYSYLYSYNLIVEMLGEVYDIDGLEALQTDGIATIEERAASVNKLIALLFERTSGTPEEKWRKIEILQEFMQPIDCEAWKPAQDAIEATKAQLKELGISREARIKLTQAGLDAIILKLAATAKG